MGSDPISGAPFRGVHWGGMAADPFATSLTARGVPADTVRPWLRLDRRAAELALTIATLLLVVVSALAERLGVAPAAHRVVDAAAYVTGGWFAVGSTVPR